MRRVLHCSLLLYRAMVEWARSKRYLLDVARAEPRPCRAGLDKLGLLKFEVLSITFQCLREDAKYLFSFKSPVEQPRAYRSRTAGHQLLWTNCQCSEAIIHELVDHLSCRVSCTLDLAAAELHVRLRPRQELSFLFTAESDRRSITLAFVWDRD